MEFRRVLFRSRHKAVDVLPHIGGSQHPRYEAAQTAGGMAVVISVNKDSQRDLRMLQECLGNALSAAAAREKYHAQLGEARLAHRGHGWFERRRIHARSLPRASNCCSR